MGGKAGDGRETRLWEGKQVMGGKPAGCGRESSNLYFNN